MPSVKQRYPLPALQEKIKPSRGQAVDWMWGMGTAESVHAEAGNTTGANKDTQPVTDEPPLRPTTSANSVERCGSPVVCDIPRHLRLSPDALALPHSRSRWHTAVCRISNVEEGDKGPIGSKKRKTGWHGQIVTLVYGAFNLMSICKKYVQRIRPRRLTPLWPVLQEHVRRIMKSCRLENTTGGRVTLSVLLYGLVVIEFLQHPRPG